MRNNKSVDYSSIKNNRNFEIYTQNLMILRSQKKKSYNGQNVLLEWYNRYIQNFLRKLLDR